ncbi:MAG: hypothetical protein U0172_08585 [Nitrospiraceae bacterium]
MKFVHPIIRTLRRASFRRLGSGIALGMTGVYLTLVCLAATCGFMPTHVGSGHAHHGAPQASDVAHVGHHEAASAPVAADTASSHPHTLASSLCAWACQASASSLLPVEPLGSPVLVAQLAPAVPDDLTVSAPLARSLFVRGPPHTFGSLSRS